MSHLAKKILMLGAVGGAIVFALLCIESKIAERMSRRDQVVAQIANDFAGSQELMGPLVVIDFPDRLVLDDKKKQTFERVSSIVLRPVSLTAAGKLTAEQRYRGLYKARTFDANLEIDGEFHLPDLKGQTIAGARVVFAVADARGIRDFKLTDHTGRAIEIKPGGANAELNSANVQAALAPGIAQAGGTLNLHAQIRLAGTGSRRSRRSAKPIDSIWARIGRIPALPAATCPLRGGSATTASTRNGW